MYCTVSWTCFLCVAPYTSSYKYCIYLYEASSGSVKKTSHGLMCFAYAILHAILNTQFYLCFRNFCSFTYFVVRLTSPAYYSIIYSHTDVAFGHIYDRVKIASIRRKRYCRNYYQIPRRARSVGAVLQHDTVATERNSGPTPISLG